MPWTPLIDADIPIYNAAAWAASEGKTEKEACDVCVTTILNWMAPLTNKQACLCCLSSYPRFRKQIWSDYKSKRIAEPPPFLNACRMAVRREFDCVSIPLLEADDVLAIMATDDCEGFSVPLIITIDKDLEQIPGWHFNPWDDDEPRFVDREEADYCFFMQWLMGDSADSYHGIPKVGPKKASAILDEADDWVEATLTAYREAGLSFEYAMAMGRMAYILRAPEYYEWKSSQGSSSSPVKLPLPKWYPFMERFRWLSTEHQPEASEAGSSENLAVNTATSSCGTENNPTSST